MEIINVADANWGTSPHHVATRFKDLGTEGATDGVKTLYIEITPGGRIMPHAHGAEVFFVLDGRGRFSVGNEEAAIRAGDRIIVPRGRVQAVINEGETPLRLLAIQPPSGTKYFWVKFVDLLRRVFT